MGLMRVETENAEYFIELERHNQIPDEIPENVDALVLEAVGWHPDHRKLARAMRKAYSEETLERRFDTTYNVAREKSIPIFYPDALPKVILNQIYKKSNLESFFLILFYLGGWQH